MSEQQSGGRNRSAELREDESSSVVQKQAMYIAKVVRDCMEGFHCEHLSDAQMRELNPIVRNAICTALHALTKNRHRSWAEPCKIKVIELKYLLSF